MKKLIALMFLTLPLFVACEKKGPVERAGEKIDDAADEVRDGAKDAADELRN